MALGSLLTLGALTAVANADDPGTSASAVAPLKAPPARSLAAATGSDRRYALANGCYALRAGGRYVAKGVGGYRASAGAVGGAEPFRMQATALGKYLFYGRARDFMSGSGSEVAVAAQPSTAAAPGIPTGRPTRWWTAPTTPPRAAAAPCSRTCCTATPRAATTRAGGR